MKKIILVALAILMTFSLCGCDKLDEISAIAKEVFGEAKNSASDFIDNVSKEASEKIGEISLPGKIELGGEAVEEIFTPEKNGKITGVSVKSLFFDVGNNNFEPVMTFIQSSENKIVVRYNSDLRDYGFSVDFEGETAVISSNTKKHFVSDIFEITVYGNCSDISLNGGIDIYMNGFNGEKLTVDIKGETDADMYNISVDTLSVSVSGAAEFDFSGEATDFSAEISGAGEIDAEKLISENVCIDITGAGEVETSCTDTLRIDVAGAGEVDYYGSPTVTKSGAGSLTVKQKSDKPYGK